MATTPDLRPETVNEVLVAQLSQLSLRLKNVEHLRQAAEATARRAATRATKAEATALRANTQVR
jgi:hypothetical protein